MKYNLLKMCIIIASTQIYTIQNIIHKYNYFMLNINYLPVTEAVSFSGLLYIPMPALFTADSSME